MTVNPASLQHPGVVVVERYQTARRPRTIGLPPVNMIEPQTAFNKQNRHGIGKYQLVEQPCVCACECEQGSVLVLNTPFDKFCHQFLCVRRVYPTAPTLRLHQSIIYNRVVFICKTPRRFYWCTRIEVKMSQRPDYLRRREPFVLTRACASFKSGVHRLGAVLRTYSSSFVQAPRASRLRDAETASEKLGAV